VSFVVLIFVSFVVVIFVPSVVNRPRR